MPRPTKPWEICRWTADNQVRVTEQGPRQRLVQVVSYPYPTERPGIEQPVQEAQAEPPKWIKVRMSPGDPTSLHELPLDELEVMPEFVKPKTIYLHYARVWNIGPNPWVFPSDMIRRDGCQLEDWNLSVDNDMPADRFNSEQKLVVLQVSTAAYPRWTPERWRSFGWAIEQTARLVMNAASGEVIAESFPPARRSK
jgi:hypothetical protein